LILEAMKKNKKRKKLKDAGKRKEFTSLSKEKCAK